jgi:hypothetical protein
MIMVNLPEGRDLREVIDSGKTARHWNRPSDDRSECSNRWWPSLPSSFDGLIEFRADIPDGLIDGFTSFPGPAGLFKYVVS